MIQHNEQATFFGVILEGSLSPVRAPLGPQTRAQLSPALTRARRSPQLVNGSPITPARGVGELIGEMAMFSGGKRNSDVVAVTGGYVAVFQFAHLQRLKTTNPELAEKVIMQLARAALAKQLEGRGGDISMLPEDQVSAALAELHAMQDATPWVAAGGDGGGAKEPAPEALLRRPSMLQGRKSRQPSTASGAGGTRDKAASVSFAPDTGTGTGPASHRASLEGSGAASASASASASGGGPSRSASGVTEGDGTPRPRKESFAAQQALAEVGEDLSKAEAAEQAHASDPATHLMSEASVGESFEMVKTLQRRRQQDAAPSGRWLLHLSDEQLHQLVRATAVVSFQAGERILVADEKPTFVALLLSGSVCEVLASGELQLRPAGEFVGEEPLFSGRPRRGDVVCVEDGAAALLAYADLAPLPDELETRMTYAMARSCAELEADDTSASGAGSGGSGGSGGSSAREADVATGGDAMAAASLSEGVAGLSLLTRDGSQSSAESLEPQVQSLLRRYRSMAWGSAGAKGAALPAATTESFALSIAAKRTRHAERVTSQSSRGARGTSGATSGAAGAAGAAELAAAAAAQQQQQQRDEADEQQNVLPSHVASSQALPLLRQCERLAPWMQRGGEGAEASLTELCVLCKRLAVVRFNTGHLVAKQAQQSSFVALVLEGELEVLMDGKPLRKVGAGACVGYAALFHGGRRESDLVGAGPGYLGVISYVELARLLQAGDAGATKLCALLARVMATQGAASNIQPTFYGELSSDLTADEAFGAGGAGASGSSRASQQSALDRLDAQRAGLGWAGQSQLLMRANAEVLYQRLKYHQLDTFSPHLPEHFVVRVLYPDGSSVVQTTSLACSVGAAIAMYRRRLAAVTSPSSPLLAGAHGTPHAEWVVQVPSTGDVFGAADDEPLAHKPYVQEYLTQMRTPLLRLCSRAEAALYCAEEGEHLLKVATTTGGTGAGGVGGVGGAGGAGGAPPTTPKGASASQAVQAAAVQAVQAEEEAAAGLTAQLIGAPLSWSSESEEVIAFRKGMREVRPPSSVAYEAAKVFSRLPTYKDPDPPMATLPSTFKVTIHLTADITKGFMASRAQRVAELLEQSHAGYCKTVKSGSGACPPLAQMCLKVVGSNEYLDDGDVLDYVYIRRCLKKQLEIRLSLVRSPLRPFVDQPPPSLSPSPRSGRGSARDATAAAAAAGAGAGAGAPASASASASSSAASRAADGALSVWDLSPHCKLRVRLLSVENLHGSVARRMREVKGGNYAWSVTVRMGIYNGGTLLCPPVATPPLPCDESTNPQWNAWLVTELPVVHVPRAARACFTLYGKPSLGKKELDEMPLGWVSMQLFDHKDHLASGAHSLRLWPDQEANPIGSSMENVSVYGLEPPVLFVQCESYVRPVRMPAEASELKATTRTMGPSPDPNEIVRIKRIIEQDPLAVLSPQDKQLIWRFKHFIVSSPAALPKFLQCHSWKDRFQVKEMHMMLRSWAPLKPVAALELLDAKFADEAIRTHAVRCLESISDGELADLVLQLTQVLKYEARHDSALARFLLRRALRCPHQVGHVFFWSLKAEMHVPEVSERYGLLIQEYLRCCGEHREHLQRQCLVESNLVKAAELVKTVPKGERKELLQAELAKVTFPPTFQLALDPRFECSGLKIGKCKTMDSKKVPLWLVFVNSDPQGKDLYVIFKCGDDLRQDQLTLQIIRIMERKWEREGLDLRLSPYGCVATGDELGFIEVVLNSDTTANITKTYAGGAGGAFSKEPMLLFLKENNPQPEQLAEAVETFLLSLAGYCVATYVIGIGDRHNDNVMLSRAGNLFHIDFGHFLGNFKSKYGVKRERAPFVFTPDFAYVLGDKGSETFERFVNVSCKAYNILRRCSHEFITLFSLMLSTGIPELQTAEDIDWLRDKTGVYGGTEMSEEDAAEFFEKQIYIALYTKTTQLNNAVHILAHS